MPHVTFTSHLQTFFPKLKQSEEVVGATVREEPICDREAQSDAVSPGDEIFILQALSGG